MFDSEMIKDYYHKGLFTDQDLELFIETGYIKKEDIISVMKTTSKAK